jgi:hypothetical protein
VENSVVIGEFDSTSSPDALRAAAGPLLEQTPGASRVDCYRRLDGDGSYDFWLIAELWDSQCLFDTDQQMRALSPSVRSYHEVFRMSRNAWGIPRQRSCSLATDTLPTSLLTIFLPVPAGRSAEWNQWYDGHHMPTVFGLATALQVGHRYAPMTSAANDEYLVLYEFPSDEALTAFQTGGTPDFKKSEYFDLWGVRNNRRAFTLEFTETRS